MNLLKYVHRFSLVWLGLAWLGLDDTGTQVLCDCAHVIGSSATAQTSVI